ncbi:hypothetical protein [Phenylobacterium sp.]|uniref:hypothetical protein n=1 Tax=Phenylobacterium sp. TaxID=1871053 RepID=UPI0030033206
MSSWFPAASLGLFSLCAALVMGTGPRQADTAAAIFPPWWSTPQVLAAADRAGLVTGVGAQPFIVVARTRPGGSDALASALRAQGAWLVVDPGLAGPCAPLAS